MDQGFIVRILGFALIPIILHGIVSLIMRENDKEAAFNPRKERIVVRPPKVLGWVAVIGMLFFTALLFFAACSLPNTPASPAVLLIILTVFIFLLDLLGAWLLWVTLIWQVEVFRREDFFILRDYWGRRHKIHYADCTSYQYRYHHQEIIVRNRIKNFTISYLLVNVGILIAALQQHHVKRETDR